MKFYCNITLIPDAEANLGFLWHKVFTQVHLALVENKLPDGNSAIAISFPEYGNKGFPLGSKLQVLAENASQLEELNLKKWLNRLSDYSHISSIKPVPEVTKYARFSRKHVDTNKERLARRKSKRENIDFDDALNHFDGFTDQQSELPYINMESLSEGARFPLFIEHELINHNVEGHFNCYGLSKAATVPWF